MKKLLLCLCVVLLLTGCSKNNEKNVLSKFTKKINNADSYYLVGDLELRNGS